MGCGLDQAHEQQYGGVQAASTNEQQRNLFGAYARSSIISYFEQTCRRSSLGIFPALLFSAFGANLYGIFQLLIMLYVLHVQRLYWQHTRDL